MKYSLMIAALILGCFITSYEPAWAVGGEGEGGGEGGGAVPPGGEGGGEVPPVHDIVLPPGGEMEPGAPITTTPPVPTEKPLSPQEIPLLHEAPTSLYDSTVTGTGPGGGFMRDIVPLLGQEEQLREKVERGYEYVEGELSTREEQSEMYREGELSTRGEQQLDEESTTTYDWRVRQQQERISRLTTEGTGADLEQTQNQQEAAARAAGQDIYLQYYDPDSGTWTNQSYSPDRQDLSTSPYSPNRQDLSTSPDFGRIAY